MRESEFWDALEWVYPGGHGRSLMQDLVLTSLGECTPAQALERGDSPQKVWIAFCEAMDLPEGYHYIHRLKPKDREGLIF